MKKTGTGAMIRERRESLNISQADLARTIGIKQPSLHNIETGKTKRSRHLPDIAIALGLDPSALRPAHAPPTITTFGGGNISTKGSADFPVYFMKAGKEGKELILSMDALEYVERPPVLSNIRDSFGICVYGDAMAPAYEAGDIVFIHPYQPPVVGTDLVIRPTDSDDMRVHIGRLTAETDKEWRLMQHHGDRSIVLKKNEWGRADRIIGKYNRR